MAAKLGFTMQVFREVERTDFATALSFPDIG